MDHRIKNKIACVIAGSDVHVFRSGSHVSNHVVIRASGKVVTASVINGTTSHMSAVVMATLDNQMWLVPESYLKDDSVLRKTEYKVAKSEELMETDDIFEELLNDKAKSNPGYPGLEYPKVKSFVSQSSPIISLRSEHHLYSMDGVVIDVDTFGDLVCVLMDRAAAVELRLFKMCVKQQHGVNEGRNQLTLLECITTGLDSSIFQNIYVKKNKCLIFAVPVPEICSDHNTSPSSLHLPVCIPQQLFTVLFGKEAACLNSPVVMVCTDKGYVYSCVVKSLNVIHKKRLNLLCQLNSDIVGISAVSVSESVMDETSAFKDIVSVLASSLKQDGTTFSKDQTRTCLVVLAASGNGCLFVPDSEYPASLLFYLPHPVQSFIVHGTSIIYSTGKSIEACELKLVQKQDGSWSVTSTITTLLGKARIHRLLPFAVSKEVDDSLISGVTCSFDLVSISTQKNVAEPDAELQASPSLKDLLGNIEQCSSTFKSLKRDSTYIDSLLLQLNIFASLVQSASQKELSGTKFYCTAIADVTYPFVTCKTGINSTKNVYKRSWSLKIVLKNTSSVSLSEDWVVVVTLCDSRDYLHHERFSQSFSVSLSRGLKCKSNLDISLPLDKLLEIHPVPLVNITVSLSLSFKDEKRNIPQNVLNKMAKVEIHRDEIDVLHFLNKLSDLNSGGDGISGELLQSDDQWLYGELRKMADRRVGQSKEYLQDGSQILSVRVGISELQCKELKLSNPSDVLSFLLKDANIEVDKTLGQHIQLEDSQGHPVTLIVTASAADVSKKSSNEGNLFIVTLKGNNSSLLLQMREAIKSRLRVCCSDAQELNCQSCRQVRRQLTSLEGLREELRVIQKRLVTHIKDKDETARLVCEMMDRSELIA